MRKLFAQELIKKARENENIWLLVGDLGYGVWDEFFKEFPDRAINCGASEQAMLDIAVGLALEGKIPFVYSIPTFLIYRPFETLRTYIDHESIPVMLVGSGRDKDYEIDGFSHDCSDVKDFLDLLPNIRQYYLESEHSLAFILDKMITEKKPSFVSLKR